MDDIPVSKFKATCAAVPDEVERTGRTVTITRRGKPIAEIQPARPQRSVAEAMGCMAGEIEVVGDIVNSPWTEEELDEIEAEWLVRWDEALRPTRPARNKRSIKEASRKVRRTK